MTRRNLLTLLALCGLLALHAAAARAQLPAQQQDAFAAQRDQAAARNPNGITFTLHLKDGKTQFRQGEIIGLELSFTSSRPGRYHLNSRAYDRSGRLDMDDFQLSPPDGLVDPLDDYFNADGIGGGFIGGGLYTTPELTTKPYIVNADLNEWFRFDRPGKYRLYVVSPRVGAGRTDVNAAPRETTSNIVEFEILPAERAWAKQRLAEIVRALDAPGKEEARRQSCRELRFLGTADAARELVRRFQGRDNVCDFEYNFGLIGSPQRTLVVAEMERQLGAPGFPVSASFLHTLARLAYVQQNLPPLPPYPTGNEAQMKVWQKTYAARRALFDEVLKRYVERLTAAVFAKDRTARATSLDTLLSFQSAPQPHATDAQAKTLAAALAGIFTDLPPDSQYMFLAYRWRQIAAPDLLPVLRRIYRQPPKTDEAIRSAALRRIYELAPDEGRRLILAEIRHPHEEVGIDVLGLLPDETLPEVESLISEKLAHLKNLGRDSYSVAELYDSYLFSDLIARYASAAVLPEVRAAFADQIGHLPCRTQTPLLAYFLRVAPAYGAEMVERALNTRTDTKCYESELSNLSAAGAVLEKIASAHLADADTVVAAQAAATLGQNGTADTESLLWTRLEQWHEQWAGRAKDLRALAEKDQMTAQTQLETALVHALGTGWGWLADTEKLNRLQQLCVTQQCRQEIENLRHQQNTDIGISFNSDDEIADASIAQYHTTSLARLKDKLAQFPAGTTFTMHIFNADAQTETRLFAELKAHLEAHGAKLVKPPADNDTQP